MFKLLTMGFTCLSVLSGDVLAATAFAAPGVAVAGRPADASLEPQLRVAQYYEEYEEEEYRERRPRREPRYERRERRERYERPRQYRESYHIRACRERYRSYNARTDTYLGNDGYRHRCRL